MKPVSSHLKYCITIVRGLRCFRPPIVKADHYPAEFKTLHKRNKRTSNTTNVKQPNNVLNHYWKELCVETRCVVNYYLDMVRLWRSAVIRARNGSINSWSVDRCFRSSSSYHCWGSSSLKLSSISKSIVDLMAANRNLLWHIFITLWRWQKSFIFNQ